MVVLALTIPAGGCSDPSPSNDWALAWDADIALAVAPLDDGMVAVGSSSWRDVTGAITDGSVRFVDVAGHIVQRVDAPGPVTVMSGRGAPTYAAGGTAWIEMDGEVGPAGWVGRFDREGNPLWVEHLAAVDEDGAQVHDVALASDDAVVSLVQLGRAAGTMLRRHDASGGLAWAITLEGTYPRAVTCLDDGDIAVVGMGVSTSNTVSVVEVTITSASGELRHHRAWPDMDAVTGVIASHEDVVYVGGTIRGDDGGDVWLGGLETVTPRWETVRTANHPGGYDFVNALVPRPGGVVATGSFNTGHRGDLELPLYQLWMAEYDRKGRIRWEYTDDHRPMVSRRSELRPLHPPLAGPDREGTFVHDATRTTDGRLVLVGSSYPGPSWSLSYTLP
jgi:hypothetical protein